MKIDLDVPILNLEGTKTLKEVDRDGEDRGQVSYRQVAIFALINGPVLANPKDYGALKEEKVNRFLLSSKIANNFKGEQEFSPEELVLLEHLVVHTQPPLVVGRFMELIDPSALKTELRAVKDEPDAS